MADGCVIKEGERFYLGETREIFDCWVEVKEYLWYAANPWHLIVEVPWGMCDMWVGGRGGATCANEDWSESIIFWASDDKGDEWVELDVERCSPPCYVRGFAYDRDGVPVSGATVYFKGVGYLTGANGYTDYVECICESGLHTASIVPPDGYTWFEGTHTVDYLCVEGYSDVNFPLVKEYVPPPYTLFQYEIAFDARVSGNPLYIAELEKYEKATAWWVGYSDPDCWDASCSNCADFLETHADGWLCAAIEYGESPCAPLPWYVCPFPSPETHYIRGECSCSHFREELQGLGIPCAHLMAAYDQTVGELPWCPYIPCA